LYLLSFGPVDRCCNKVITQTSTTNTDSGEALSVVRVVRYPGWVSILYRPAFYLMLRSDLYGRYIAWWNHGDEPR
jgi:hypothetical protein